MSPPSLPSCASMSCVNINVSTLLDVLQWAWAYLRHALCLNKHVVGQSPHGPARQYGMLVGNICKGSDQHSKWLYKMDRVHTLPCVVQPVNHERSRQQTAKVDLTWQQLKIRRTSTFSGSVSPPFFLKATRTSCRRTGRLFVCP